MKSFLFVIFLLTICGCGPPVDYEAMRCSEVDQYLVENPDAIERVLETTLAIYAENDPEIGWQVTKLELGLDEIAAEAKATDMADLKIGKDTEEFIREMKTLGIVRSESEWDMVVQEFEGFCVYG